MWVASAVLHVLVLLALAWRRHETPPEVAPSDEVALVFEHAPVARTTPDLAKADGHRPASALPAPSPVPVQPAPAQPVPEPTRPVASAPPRLAIPPSDRPALPKPAREQPPRAPAQTSFPRPMMQAFSLGGSALTPLAASVAHHDEFAAPRGRSINSFDIRGAERLGPDWMAEFAGWVERHKHYPEEAIANDEDGTSEVAITIARDGRVEDVSMLSRSGSQWLDLGTLSMFRGRTLPQFPPDTKEAEVTVQFTMHYIIVR